MRQILRTSPTARGVFWLTLAICYLDQTVSSPFQRLARLSHELSATAPDPSASARALYFQWRQPACGHERLIRREERAATRPARGTRRSSDGVSDSSRRKPVRKAGWWTRWFAPWCRCCDQLQFAGATRWCVHVDAIGCSIPRRLSCASQVLPSVFPFRGLEIAPESPGRKSQVTRDSPTNTRSTPLAGSQLARNLHRHR